MFYVTMLMSSSIFLVVSSNKRCLDFHNATSLGNTGHPVNTDTFYPPPPPLQRPCKTTRGMGTSFRRNDFWDHFAG